MRNVSLMTADHHCVGCRFRDRDSSPTFGSS
jgi:hypothetical protein